MKPKMAHIESVRVSSIKCGSVKVTLDFLFSVEKTPENTATYLITG